MNSEKFIIDNYAKLGAKKCSIILNLSVGQVSYLAQKHKLLVNREVSNKINSESKIKPNEKCKVSLVKFTKKIDKHGAYILGLLWADGYLLKKDNSSNNIIKIECLAEDMKYFKISFDKTGLWDYYERKRSNRKLLICANTSNKALRDYLVDNDYLVKSSTSPIKIINKLPKSLVKFFILGVIDGDGCFYFNKKYGLRQFTITGSLNQDWEAFESILKKIKIDYRINRVPNNKNGYSQIRIINKANIKKLGDFIYSTHRMDKIGLVRKHDKYLNIVEI